jgi:hypothetical protein
LSKGVNVKVVSEMLGHASITITLNTYSHVLRDMQDTATEAMESYRIRVIAYLLHRPTAKGDAESSDGTRGFTLAGLRDLATPQYATVQAESVSCTDLAHLLNVYVSRKISWHRNRPPSRSRTRRPYRWPPPQPCKLCATTDTSSQGTRS